MNKIEKQNILSMKTGEERVLEDLLYVKREPQSWKVSYVDTTETPNEHFFRQSLDSDEALISHLEWNRL